jgi:hypothetical protein
MTIVLAPVTAARGCSDVGELVGIVAIRAGHSMCRRAAAAPETRAAVELVRD